MARLYAQVILPLPLHDSYTYHVPEQWQDRIKPGQRVVVQFGVKKLYAALVSSLSTTAPDDLEIKEVLEVLDEEPVVLPINIEFWKWIAAYYCCSLGDVFRAALPPGLKLESKSKIVPDETPPELALSSGEAVIFDYIQNNEATLESLQKKLGKGFSVPALKSLLNKKAIRVEEQIGNRYKPKQ